MIIDFNTTPILLHNEDPRTHAQFSIWFWNTHQSTSHTPLERAEFFKYSNVCVERSQVKGENYLSRFNKALIISLEASNQR